VYIVELLLPLKATPPGRALYGSLRKSLTERFGGVTAFTRAPAEGLWDSGAGIEKDDIVVLEVMTEELDRDWWRDFRRKLEQNLREKELVIRCHAIEKL
jgi:hypothetical protein